MTGPGKAERIAEAVLCTLGIVGVIQQDKLMEKISNGMDDARKMARWVP